MPIDSDRHTEFSVHCRLFPQVGQSSGLAPGSLTIFRSANMINSPKGKRDLGFVLGSGAVEFVYYLVRPHPEIECNIEWFLKRP